MSSPAPKRRLDARQQTSQRVAGKRVAKRTARRRGILRPTPAMAGAFALIVAGLGSAVITDGAGADSLRPGYQTISASFTDNQQAAAAADVDISRSFDRDLLKRQTEAQVAQRDLALSQLAEKTQARATELRKNQWVLPVTGYHLTARFGQRSALWSRGTHTGLDFAGPAGTTIVSVAGGTVTSTGYEGAYGNRTIITLEDGTEVWYCHQSRITVRRGQQVDPGEVIGYTGSTGNVTGPHLHVEIHPNGAGPIDPYAAFLEHDVRP